MEQKTLEQIRADSRGRTEKDKAEAATIAGVVALLAAHDIKKASSVYGFAYCGEGQATIHAANRMDALKIARRFKWEPIAIIRDGCLSIKPRSAVTEKEEKRADDLKSEFHKAAGIYWSHNPSRHVQNNERNSLTFWTQGHGAGLVKISIKILDDPATTEADHQRDDRGHIIAHRWQTKRAPHGTGIRFSSGDSTRPGQRKVWFYDADENPGADTLETCLDPENGGMWV